MQGSHILIKQNSNSIIHFDKDKKYSTTYYSKHGLTGSPTLKLRKCIAMYSSWGN